jgi:hypothetical protein
MSKSKEFEKKKIAINKKEFKTERLADSMKGPDDLKNLNSQQREQLRKEGIALYEDNEHKFPTTRREFLHMGFGGGAAALMAPTLLSEAAMAACVGGNAGAGGALRPRATFGEIMTRGGWIPSFSFIPQSNPATGDLITDMRRIGLGRNANGGQALIQEFGTTVHVSPFIRSMMSRMSAEARARTQVVFIPSVTENDDANVNRVSIIRAVESTGLPGQFGGMLAAGRGDNQTGTFHLNAANVGQQPPKMSRSSDITRALAGDIQADPSKLGRALKTRVMESIKSISDRTMTRGELMRSLASLQASEMFGCGVDSVQSKLANTVIPFADLIDPQNLAPDATQLNAIRSAFAIDAGTNERDFRVTAGSVVTAGLTDATPGFAIGMPSSYDYHNGRDREGPQNVRDLTRTVAVDNPLNMGQVDTVFGNNAADTLEVQLGHITGATLETAHVLQKPVFLYHAGDGSVNHSNEQNESYEGQLRQQWGGDNGSRGGQFFIMYHPQGRPSVSRTQINEYVNNREASRDGLINDNRGEDAAAAAFLNFVRWTDPDGYMAKAQSVFPAQMAKWAGRMDEVLVVQSSA